MRERDVSVNLSVVDSVYENEVVNYILPLKVDPMRLPVVIRELYFELIQDTSIF